MKLVKFAFVCAAVASLTAVADDVPVSSTLALLKVNNTNNLHTVAVGINFAAADGSAVSVSNAVKTAGLPTGTKLYAFDKANSRYYVYGIKSGYWTSEDNTYYLDANGKLTQVEQTGADAMTLPAGSAAFLVFPSGETPSASDLRDILVAGQPVSASASALAVGANLCCFPVGKEVNLNTDTDDVAKLFTSPAATTFKEDTNKTIVTSAGDTIVVLTKDSGASRVYYYDGAKWGYIGRKSGATAKTFITDESVIPGGLGFWYNKQ